MLTRLVGWGAAALVVSAIAVGPVYADRVRYHFAPADLCGSTVQTPAGKCNAIGERVSYFGFGNEPYNAAMRPTHLVTFVHPATKKQVVVPLRLPDATPRIEYRSNRVIFNYGSYTVEAVFLPDGSVDAIYDSGIFKPLK